MKWRHASIGVLMAFLLSACGGPKTLKPEQTYLNLKPVKALPVYDLEKLPVNMEVVIDNVADMGTSYKNRAELYLNGFKIQPEEPVSNVQSTYRYRLKLQPGFYDVRGYYYALDGFVERKYPIRPQTEVMVKPGYLTKVTCHIEKNWDGTPVGKQLFFSVTYEPLKQTAPKTISEKQTSNPVEKEPVPEAASRPHGHHAKVHHEKGEAKSEDLIVLQVNTAPPGADVIVDDKYIGQSPLRVLVDRNSSHILQLSLDGYEDVIKYLDQAHFGSERVIYFMQKMKPKHPKQQK